MKDKQAQGIPKFSFNLKPLTRYTNRLHFSIGKSQRLL